MVPLMRRVKLPASRAVPTKILLSVICGCSLEKTHWMLAPSTMLAAGTV